MIIFGVGTRRPLDNLLALVGRRLGRQHKSQHEAEKTGGFCKGHAYARQTSASFYSAPARLRGRRILARPRRTILRPRPDEELAPKHVQLISRSRTRCKRSA